LREGIRGTCAWSRRRWHSCARPTHPSCHPRAADRGQYPRSAEPSKRAEIISKTTITPCAARPRDSSPPLPPAVSRTVFHVSRDTPRGMKTGRRLVQRCGCRKPDPEPSVMAHDLAGQFGLGSTHPEMLQGHRPEHG
jgi:hypothetical protein